MLFWKEEKIMEKSSFPILYYVVINIPRKSPVNIVSGIFYKKIITPESG